MRLCSCVHARVHVLNTHPLLILNVFKTQVKINCVVLLFQIYAYDFPKFNCFIVNRSLTGMCPSSVHVSMVGLRSSSLNMLIAATLALEASGANEVALPIVILHMISANTTLK